jgi:hypothetical protein
VVITSTGWTDSTGWSTVSNGQMLVVERSTLNTSVVPVAVPGRVVEAAAG